MTRVVDSEFIRNPKGDVQCPLSSSTIPLGYTFSSHPRSWSLAWLSPRVTPPREKSPIFTVALQNLYSSV